MKTSSHYYQMGISINTLFKFLAVGLLMVSCHFISYGQVPIFTEDFEGSTSGWTIQAISGPGNSYWTIASQTCSYGSGTSMNIRRANDGCLYKTNKAEDTRSYHQVDATGYENLKLTFNWMAGGESGLDFGEIYYSFDASTWTKINTGGDGSGNYWNVTSWTTQSDVSMPTTLNDTIFYISFNWQQNNSGGIQPAFNVDNISITGEAITTPPPPTNSDTIFAENFSSGSLPTGWSNTDNVSGGTWYFNNPGSRTINTQTSANGFAIFDSDYRGSDGQAEDADLETVAFDCSGYDIIDLSFQHYFRAYDQSYLTVEVSGDNGSSYTQIYLDSINTSNAETKSIEISQLAGNQSQVKLRFSYHGDYDWYWAVDDIVVTGEVKDTANWTGTTGTDWNDTTNWDTGEVPGLATNVNIPASATNMPQINDTVQATCYNLYIETGATLTDATSTSSGGSFTVKGSLTVDGSIIYSGDVDIQLRGTGQNISGDFSGSTDVNWILVDGANYSLDGDFMSYSLTVQDGATLDLNGNDISVYNFNAGGHVITDSSNFTIAGSTFYIDSTEFDFGTSTVIFATGASEWSAKPLVNQTIPSYNYYNLQVEPYTGYYDTLGNGIDLSVQNDLRLYNTSGGSASVVMANTIYVGNDLVLGDNSNDGIDLTISYPIIGSGSSQILMPATDETRTLSTITIDYQNDDFAAINGFLGGTPTFKCPVSYSGSGNQIVIPASYSDLNLSGSGTKYLGGDISLNAQSAGANSKTGDLNLNTITLSTVTSNHKMYLSSTDADVAVAVVNGGLVSGSNVPLLADLQADATPMTIDFPSAYASYDLEGVAMTIEGTRNSDLDVYLVDPDDNVHVIRVDGGAGGDGMDGAQYSDDGTDNESGTLTGDYPIAGTLVFSSYSGTKVGTWTLYVLDDADNADNNNILKDFKLLMTNPDASADISIQGDWNNTGATFTSDTASVTFNGASAQAMTTNGDVFYNVTMNNTSTGLTINDDLSISNAITFTKGALTTGSNNLIVTNTDSSGIVGGSDASFVNGNLRRYITSNTQTYVFPVGNGTSSSNYYGAIFTNNNLNKASYFDIQFTTLVNHNDADLVVTVNNSPIITIATEGMWVIEPDAQPTSGSYSLSLTTENISGLSDNAFAILKRPVGSLSGADWTNGGGLISAPGGYGRMVADGVAYVTGLTNFSEFGVGSGGGGLPIQLINFNARVTDNKQVQLLWNTATEINNDYFTVERSADGVTYKAIGKVAGAGNSSVPLSYQLMDAEPLAGTSYYRLRQTDYNGESDFSDPIAVTIDKQMEPTVEVTAYPNPSTGKFSLILNHYKGQATISIINETGAEVYSKNIIANTESTTSAIRLNDELPAGIYYISVDTGQGQFGQSISICR